MSLKESIKKKLTADVVVIGGGGAGVPAALTASEKGAKKVIVIDKRFVTGGDALRANWIMAIESRLQKEAGVTLTRDGMYKQAMEFHRYDGVNPKILRALIWGTADTVQWLEDKGVVFDLRAMGDPKTASSHWLKGAPAGDSLCSFGPVFRLLTQKCKESGIKFLFRTSGKKILCGVNGKITGVLAETKDGQEIEIKTRSVILCPGSFIGNKELLKKYFPYYYDENAYITDALLSNVGEGIQMAADAGAGMADYCTLIRHGGKSFETTINLRRDAGSPYTIWVNKNGQRYLAENAHETSGNVLTRQPGKIAYALYDDKIVQSIVDKGAVFKQPRVSTPLAKLPDFRTFLKEQAQENQETVATSNNWDGIAKWIGCESAVLNETIKKYNSFCDKGHDDDYSKDKQFLLALRTPPYYAVKFNPLMIETIGPVKVDERMQVVDKSGVPIPGFFAAGVLTSGWESYDYGGTPGGTALGFSMTSGRIAGDSAARFALGK